MRCLYIDTSSSFLYSAITEDDKVISEVKEEYGQSLSEVALPKIVEMFNKNNLSPKDVDKIFVVNGPGSFTGIRIGVTIAKVYAWGLNIPITTISSLEAMAISSEKQINHIPIINARRGYVYGAIYNKDLKPILKQQHIKLEELIKKAEDLDKYEYISNDEFDLDIKLESYNPNISKIISHYKDKESVNPHSVNPEYLKKTAAEESKNDQRT